MRTVPLVPGRGASLLGEAEREAVLEVLEGRSLFRYYGPSEPTRAAAFERAVAGRLQTPHALAVSSGTAALRCALLALGVGCGDEVIVPAFTFVATVNAVVACAAMPVFAEVDDSLCLDAADVEARLSERTRAIVAVHLDNVACDMDALLAVARRHGIPVVEDAAQAMGATYHGRSLGTLGEVGAFSLQYEKNITSGEGGVLVTADPGLHRRAERYQDHGGEFVTGQGKRRGQGLAEHFCGENLRIGEIAAAIALVQLGRLDSVLAGLRGVKRCILEMVGEVEGLTPRRLPDPDGDGASGITWLVRDAATAQRVVESLRGDGVPAVRMYDGLPVYAAPAILQRRTASMKGGPWHCAEHPPRLDYAMGMCPRTEELVARAVTVWLGATWSEADCADVAAAVQRAASLL